jgi:hypothetical protein
MAQWPIIVISTVSGVLLGLFSNWLYDLLKNRDILPERPTLKRFIAITIGLIPLLILVALPDLIDNRQQSPISCTITPQKEFGEAWRAHERQLGCATEQARRLDIAEQPFERGHMFWRSDSSKIYVVYDKDGVWESFTDTWPSLPTPIPQVNIPNSSLLVPTKGFGNVWYRQLGGPNSRIGFATYPEQLFQDWVWQFEHGFMLKDSDQTIYVLIDDKTFATLKSK